MIQRLENTLVKRSSCKMQIEDFKNDVSKLSKAKGTNYPYLDNITVAEFRQGKTCLYWKEDKQQPEFYHGEFLQKKFATGINAHVFTPNSLPRGISIAKKRDIITELCPLMGHNRQLFWKELPTSEEVEDLLDDHHLQDEINTRT